MEGHVCPVSPLEEKCFHAWDKAQDSVHMCEGGSRLEFGLNQEEPKGWWTEPLAIGS